MPPKKKTDEPVQTSTATAIATGVTSEGVLDVEATTGDGGARELEVTAAQEKFDALGAEIDLSGDPGGLVRRTTATVLDFFKNRPKPWSQMGKAEQQDFIKGLEHNCHELVREIVEQVSSQQGDPVRCLFVGFTDKGDDIKAELKVKPSTAEEMESAVLFFHRARGLNVMVSMASAMEFHRDPAKDESEADQRGLEFDAGEDVDLEAAAEPEELGRPALPLDTSEVVHTGDLLVTDKGMFEARIDLKSGWLQMNNGESEADDWSDVREASPAELAAERERTADFDDAETVTPEEQPVDAE